MVCLLTCYMNLTFLFIHRSLIYEVKLFLKHYVQSRHQTETHWKHTSTSRVAAERKWVCFDASQNLPRCSLWSTVSSSSTTTTAMYYVVVLFFGRHSEKSPSGTLSFSLQQDLSSAGKPKAIFGWLIFTTNTYTHCCCCKLIGTLTLTWYSTVIFFGISVEKLLVLY